MVETVTKFMSTSGQTYDTFEEASEAELIDELAPICNNIYDLVSDKYDDYITYVDVAKFIAVYKNDILAVLCKEN